MLLYANERLWPLIFAVVLSIGSKVILRAPVGNGHTQHIFNPSNLGVATTLILLPEVGFAPRGCEFLIRICPILRAAQV